MISRTDLQKMAQAKLEDAEALLQAQRYDSAVYICGYAIELALKARICLVLNWNGYPSNNAEFQKYQSFKTHDLKVLLRLSGTEAIMRNKYRGEWSAVNAWTPELRYPSVGSTSFQTASSIYRIVILESHYPILAAILDAVPAGKEQAVFRHEDFLGNEIKRAYVLKAKRPEKNGKLKSNQKPRPRTARSSRRLAAAR
jgi:HEPN domain-containing protein